MATKGVQNLHSTTSNPDILTFVYDGIPSGFHAWGAV